MPKIYFLRKVLTSLTDCNFSKFDRKNCQILKIIWFLSAFDGKCYQTWQIHFFSTNLQSYCYKNDEFIDNYLLSDKFRIFHQFLKIQDNVVIMSSFFHLCIHWFFSEFFNNVLKFLDFEMKWNETDQTNWIKVPQRYPLWIENI